MSSTFLFKVGFDAGDGKVFYTLPGFMTSGVLNLASSSNVGLNGRWMFRVDGKNIILPNKVTILPGLISVV
jgi:Nidogen-like